MTQASSPSRPPPLDGSDSSLATVRLEVRSGMGRAAAYEVCDGGFLIGSVPGCDLRLPGSNLPPIICVIGRCSSTASLRRLAPVLPILVNGESVANGYLKDGDTIRIGPIEIVVTVQPATAPQVEDRLPQPEQESAASPDEQGSSLRRDLTEIRQQLYQRYHERRERLIKQQQAIHRAARRLQQRKQRLDVGETDLAARRQEWEQKQIDIEGRGEQVERERQLLDEQHRLIVSRQQEVQRDLNERFQEVQTRETKLTTAEADLEKGQKQHQADLVRLDRIQAMLEKRQKQLQVGALEVDRRYEQLQRDTRDLEEQAAQLDEWHTRLLSESEELTKRKTEQEKQIEQQNQRAAVLEGQQAMLATLRTRLERMREEMRQQEQALNDQRVAQEAAESDLRTRLVEAEKIRTDVDNDRQLHDEDRRRFQERQTTMESAVAQLRQARDALEEEEKHLRLEQEQVRTAAAEQAEQAALLTVRGNQLEAEREKHKSERLALQERETALVRAEQALATLQDQVRRRVEEVSDKQRLQSEEEQKLQDEAARLSEQAKIVEQERQLAESRLSLTRQELGDRTADLDAQARKLVEVEEKNKAEQQRIEEAQASLGGQRQVMASARIAFEVERQKVQDETHRLRGELEASRQEIIELSRQLPELEARASSSLERLTQAREQLREHLSEIHGYVRQSRGDMEHLRRDFQAEVERIRQQELALHAARDEHRLAVAAFRQQIVEWQGRLAERKQTLHRDETRVERRASEVSEQARQIADESARLAQQAEQLQQQQRLVSERRGEVDRHLGDMQQWYRRKMRELAGLDVTEQSVPTSPQRQQGQSESEEHSILSMMGGEEPGDRQLGDLLHSLELIDGDTLAAFLLQARRQRRSLRQLLLAGNYLTLFQMALIEVGNLDGLVLGPLRVIDRLQATPREAVYRVFDPRRNRELMLRHLAESEMADAVRPDEFRQRFAAATVVQHENVTATLEVLEIAGRPAALQEMLHGLPSTEWPVLSAAPSVWQRLLSQAAHALHAAHTAGLIHDHLHASSFVFTRDGVLKMCGLGEPRWLAVPPPQENEEPSAARDLAALGHIAAGWAAATPTIKGGKAKGMPAQLQNILARLLEDDASRRYGDTAALLEDLERANSQAPAKTEAWERFVRQVRDESAALRESA